MRAESLSISVADTRETVVFTDDDEYTITATLTLPHQQAAPLAVVDFCQNDEERKHGPEELLVKDAFTAHLSLRCVSDEQQTVKYASQTLDLSLLCEAVDQGSSADSAAR